MSRTPSRIATGTTCLQKHLRPVALDCKMEINFQNIFKVDFGFLLNVEIVLSFFLTFFVLVK